MLISIDLDELIQALHGMLHVERLHLQVVGLTEIVHRGDIAFARAAGTANAAKLHLVVVSIPIDGFQEDVVFMIGIVKRPRPHAAVFPVEQDQMVVVVIAEPDVVVIDGVDGLVDGVVKVDTDLRIVGCEVVVCHRETWRHHSDGNTVLVLEHQMRQFRLCPCDHR